MPRAPATLETDRLRLRLWRDVDETAFAALHTDPEVTKDLGGPLHRAECARKLVRYRAAFDTQGIGRWAVETREGDFLGYAGVMPVADPHPLGPHFDIGWRLRRGAWGRGYATEAARAALDDAFARRGLAEILAYAAADNGRSIAVMTRLQMQRDPARDFVADYAGVGAWHGLVWVARPA